VYARSLVLAGSYMGVSILWRRHWMMTCILVFLELGGSTSGAGDDRTATGSQILRTGTKKRNFPVPNSLSMN
jgi:hypothetical protein